MYFCVLLDLAGEAKELRTLIERGIDRLTKCLGILRVHQPPKQQEQKEADGSSSKWHVAPTMKQGSAILIRLALIALLLGPLYSQALKSSECNTGSCGWDLLRPPFQAEAKL